MSKILNFKNFLRNITNKKISVGIIGLGYVGLPLAILIASKKYTVYGFDNDSRKIDLLKKGKSYLKSLPNKKISNLKNFSFTSSDKFENIKICNVIIICVPTPLHKDKTSNTDYIKSAMLLVKKYIKPFTLVILESTSYPGTTNDFIFDQLKSKFTIGKNIFISFSPERINPGRNENSLQNIPKVISGKTKNCLKAVKSFYKNIFSKLHQAPNLETAEFSKLLENIYRAVNIGFINEMKHIAQKLNIDIYDAILAAKTKPYGFRPFIPGPGIGGHCIPIDPYFLSWKAKKHGANSDFIKLAGVTNELTLERIINRVINFAKQTNKKKPKILIIGLAYKKNVDDDRESPAWKVIKNLQKLNYEVSVYDNYVSTFDKKNIKKRIKKLDYKKNYFDCSVILTDHSKVDYKKIYQISQKIFDTRYVYKFKDIKIERI